MSCGIVARHQLIAAVAPVAASGVTFICAPPQALMLQLQTGTNFKFEVLSSPALPTGTVVALVPQALVIGLDSAPRFGNRHCSPNIVAAMAASITEMSAALRGPCIRLGSSLFKRSCFHQQCDLVGRKQ